MNGETDAQMVDELISKFVSEWRDGGVPPAIESYLENVPSEMQSSVRRNLLIEELQHKWKMGRYPTRDRYRSDFDNDVADVERAFFDAGCPTPNPDKSAPPRFGDYIFEKYLGRGGMGEVYEAKQKWVNRRVAVKVLSLADGSEVEAVYRFNVEAEVMHAFSHPNIVSVDGLGRTPNGSYFLVLQLIDGTDLDRTIKAVQQLELKQLISIVLQVAQAVHHAHENQVLHRDLKPANVLLEGEDRVYVTDFGLAKVLNSKLSGISGTKQFLGTWSYSAPEQIDARYGTVGIPTDVYGIGAILYAFLSGGEVPNSNGIERMPLPPYLQRHELEPPCGLLARLETICGKCLQKNPEDRYGSAAEVAEVLEECAKQAEQEPTGCVVFPRSQPWNLDSPTTNPVLAPGKDDSPTEPAWVRDNARLAGLIQEKKRILRETEEESHPELRLSHETARQAQIELFNHHDDLVRLVRNTLPDTPIDELNRLLDYLSHSPSPLPSELLHEFQSIPNPNVLTLAQIVARSRQHAADTLHYHKSLKTTLLQSLRTEIPNLENELHREQLIAWKREFRAHLSHLDCPSSFPEDSPLIPSEDGLIGGWTSQQLLEYAKYIHRQMLEEKERRKRKRKRNAKKRTVPTQLSSQVTPPPREGYPWRVSICLGLFVVALLLVWNHLSSEITTTQASTAYEKNDFDEAIALCNAILEREPNNAEAHHLRGQAYTAKHDYVNARSDFLAATRLVPTNAQYVCSLGGTCFHLKDHDSALQHFTEAIHLDPSLATAYAWRGKVHSTNRRDPESLEDFRVSVDLEPTNTQFLCELGIAHTRMGNYNEALLHFNEALRINPGCTLAAHWRDYALSVLQGARHPGKP